MKNLYDEFYILFQVTPAILSASYMYIKHIYNDINVVCQL